MSYNDNSEQGTPMGEELHKQINRILAQLGEHFDSVQIIATRHNPSDGSTQTMERGVGNYFARMASVQSWYEYNLERNRDGAREGMGGDEG